MEKLNKDSLGQFWTPKFIVNDMMQLIKNNGLFLEPSAGSGAFLKELPLKQSIGIEIDKKFKMENLINEDFFNFKFKDKFDTIIGNPPYVKFQNINQNTKLKLINLNKIYKLDSRTNLYMFFIRKCIDLLKNNGELIFITPRDFMTSTSGRKLNKYLYSKGSFTDFIDLSDKKIFFNSDVDSIIWRFEKNNFNRKTNIIHHFILTKDNQLLLSKTKPFSYINDFFYVKVGAASGANDIFKNNNGIPFVVSTTVKTNKTVNFFYNIKNNYLLKHKAILINRKIGNFNENNWYKWGRNFFKSNEERIYVNCKTREKNPFFYHGCKNYDGSVLAIFSKNKINKSQILQLIIFLNSIDWNRKGLKAGERFIFSQNSLLNAFLDKKETLELKNILNI